jgi:misacylated tRNA(Ala) deacylase
VSCVPAHLEQLVNGKKEKINGYDVVLEDTVFFPEGGGQVNPIYIYFVLNNILLL